MSKKTPKTIFTAGDYFILRSPLLPVDDFIDLAKGCTAAAIMLNKGSQNEAREAFIRDCELVRQRLVQRTKEHLFRDALTVSSMSLVKSLDRWEESFLSRRGAATERGIFKYLTRATTRCTPFGLMAGVAAGRISDDTVTRLSLGNPAENRRHVRGDAQTLLTMAQLVALDSSCRRQHRYFTNSTLYATESRYRYYESPGNPFGAIRQLVSVGKSELVRRIVERAATGITWNELLTLITIYDPDIGEEEANDFLNELVSVQLLVPDIFPSPFGKEMLANLKNRIALRTPNHPARQAVEELYRASMILNRLPMGKGQQIYEKAEQRIQTFIAKQAENLVNQAKKDEKSGAEEWKEDASADTSEDESSSSEGPSCFQVDMALSVRESHLARADLEPLLAAVDSLYFINSQEPPAAMKAFAEEFRRRYEDKSVPLVEVIDPDRGIRFGIQGRRQLEPSPLLRLPFGEGPGMPSAQASAVDAWRAMLLVDKWRKGRDEINLSAKEIREHFPEAGSVPPALSMHAHVSLGRIGANQELGSRLLSSGKDPDTTGDEPGRLRWNIINCGGGHTFVMSGRFAHVLGDDLYQLLIEDARREQELYPGILAEVNYLPPSKLGNVYQHPRFRDYVITYMCPPPDKDCRNIPANDLLVSVYGDTVVLHSRTLGVPVYPRIDSALNIAHMTNPALFSFLGMIQYQGVQSWLGWKWGLLDDLPELPRILIDGVVVCPRKWNLSADSVRKLGGKPSKDSFQGAGFESFARVQEWRLENGIPRFIAVGDMTDFLAIDLENPLSVDLFLRQIRRNPKIREISLVEKEQVVNGETGNHTNEMTIPLWNRTANPTGRDVTEMVPLMSAAMQPFYMSSRYPAERRLKDGVLFAKIYGGESHLDHLLRNELGRFIRLTSDSPLIDEWFFIRYNDPDFHVRLRFFGNPDFLAATVMPGLEATCMSSDRTGVWRLSFDAYDPEYSRYGGPIGMRLAERCFGIDSRYTLSLISAQSDIEGKDLEDRRLVGIANRWLLAMASADRLLSDWGMELPEKLGFVTSYGEQLVRDHGVNTKHFKTFGKFYGAHKATLFDLLNSQGTEAKLPPVMVDIFTRRSKEFRDVFRQLEIAERNESLSISRSDLISSYFHMHCNRIFIYQSRRQEGVLLQILKRFYTTALKIGQTVKDQN